MIISNSGFHHNWTGELFHPLFQLARFQLELLAQSFNTPLLRLPAIRRQLLLTLEKNDDPLFQNCCLEIFIRLLNQEPGGEEILDQEIFLKRAKIQLAEVPPGGLLLLSGPNTVPNTLVLPLIVLKNFGESCLFRSI